MENESKIKPGLRLSFLFMTLLSVCSAYLIFAFVSTIFGSKYWPFL